jgi:hypothetical protein
VSNGTLDTIVTGILLGIIWNLDNFVQILLHWHELVGGFKHFFFKTRPWCSHGLSTNQNGCRFALWLVATAPFCTWRGQSIGCGWHVETRHWVGLNRWTWGWRWEFNT